MSAISNGLRMRFAGLLREVLRRFDGNETGAGISQPPRLAVPVPPSPLPLIIPLSARPAAPAAPKPIMAPAVPLTLKPEQVEKTTDLELPLQSVLETLPLELKSKMRARDIDLNRASISIAFKKIQPQLALGVVRITFGELRRAAPGLFDVRDEYDSLSVVLPLNKVLERLNPNLLARNSAQKTVEVPAEIIGPFGTHGQGISISKASVKPPTPATPPAQLIVATPPIAPFEPQPAPVAPPPVVPPLPFMPRPMTPAPAVISAPHSGNGANNGALPKPAIAKAPVQPIIAPVMSVAPPVTPIPMPAATSSAAPAPATILMPLAVLSEKWPEALQSEIVQLTSANIQVALPVDLLEPALKRGRVTFTWGNLRSWMKPTPPAASAHDAVEVELPLKAVVPHFLGRQNGAMGAARLQRTAPALEKIPNMFFGFPQPQPPAATQEAPPKAPAVDERLLAPKPVEINRPATDFLSWDKPDTPRAETCPDKIEHKQPATSDFSKHSVTPKEVVSRATALTGVAGAVVALPDGLMVASQVPSILNADTLAAFLPQIFDRVNQSAKELHMGALNNLNFTVGGVPWEIFRVNGVYFAAFGRAGEQLPVAQLNTLASELDSKKQ